MQAGSLGETDGRKD